MRQARYRPSDRRIVVPGAATELELGSDDNLYARVDDVREVSVASLVRATKSLHTDRAEDVTTLLFVDVPATQFFPDFVPVETTLMKFFGEEQVRVIVEGYSRPSQQRRPALSSTRC